MPKSFSFSLLTVTIVPQGGAGGFRTMADELERGLVSGSLDPRDSQCGSLWSRNRTDQLRNLFIWANLIISLVN